VEREFGDWYRAAGITPSEDQLKRRWQGVEALATSANRVAVLDWVRLFYGLPPKQAETGMRLREAFQQADASFPTQRNDLEVQLLAGATVVATLATAAPSVTDVAALAVVCADYRGHREDGRPIFVMHRARQYLLQRSIILRRGAADAPIRIPEDLKSLAAKPQEGAAQLEPNQAIRSIAGATVALARSFSEVVEQLRLHDRLQREESEILWWIFGGYSRDLERPFSDLEVPARCLVAAKELADLMDVLPGPVAAAAMLDRIIQGPNPGAKVSNVTLVQAIQRTPEEWLRSWCEGNELIQRHGDLCPTLIAAQRAVEAPGTDVWVTPIERITRVSVRIEVPPINLATQAYDEHRLLRALRTGS